MMSTNVDSCIIINLDERIDLWENLTQFREIWTNLGKQFTRIPGINYKNNVNVLNEFISKNRLSLNGTGFRIKKDSMLGELGCYMAHYNAWKYVMGNKLECCLILEDGIELLRTDFANLEIENNADILFVNEEMRQNDDKHFVGYGLQGYVITYKGAVKLLDKCYTLINPIDLQVRNICNEKIMNGITIVNPFVKRKSDRLSSIGDDDLTDDLNSKQNFNCIIHRILTNLISQNVNLDDYI